MNNTDKQYQDLLALILEKGKIKKNRTGVDTIGVFGAQARFDLSEGFPLLTTKKMATKAIIHELLWFLSGSTNIKYLVDNDVHIWDGDCYRKYKEIRKELLLLDSTLLTKEEFIEKIKTDDKFAQRWGDLGEGTYGQMWRAFPYLNRDEIDYDYVPNTTIDQVQKIIDTLKTNPDSRRMIVSAWHPYWVDHCALPPCHCLFHFNTEELSVEEREILLHKKLGITDGRHRCADVPLKTVGDMSNIPTRRLNCLLYQRSCDGFLGVPMNISSYSLLMSMVAQVVNMEPGIFVHTYGDLHLYQNHIEQAKLQSTREPYPLPKLSLNPEIRNIFDFKYEDIKIENYQSHPTIKGDLSVG